MEGETRFKNNFEGEDMGSEGEGVLTEGEGVFKKDVEGAMMQGGVGEAGDRISDDKGGDIGKPGKEQVFKFKNN
jgi:hypothetical protein